MTINFESRNRLSLRTPNGEVPFTVFGTKDGASHATSILEGHTYPRMGFLQNVKTVVDVGANVGAASLFFALSFPQANIFAFEPFPDAYRLMVENLSRFPQIRTFGFGLLDRETRAPMFVSEHDPVTNSISKSSLNSNRSQEIVLREAMAVLTELNLDTIDILKIDTEGCEVPILRSLKPLLPRVRAIYLEYHDDADRSRIDSILGETHLLCAARVVHPHRGELCFGNCKDLPVEHLRIIDPTAHQK
jgi:FkbM family methyltransferase